MRRWIWGLFIGAMLAGCSEPSEINNDEPLLEVTRLEGIVVDASVRPIADARVRLGDQETQSGDTGGFSFDVEPGIYLVEVTKTGYQAAQAEGTPGTKLQMTLVQNQTIEPFAVPTVWEGFIACSGRLGTAGQGPTMGLNACNDIADQDVEHVHEFPAGTPDWFQTELVWDSTQVIGDELSLTAGEASCIDSKEYMRSDGPSPLVLSMDEFLVRARQLDEANGLCSRVFSYTSGTVAHAIGMQLQQRFSIFGHSFYHFQPEPGWVFATDGQP